ncbi:MAG: carboxypeptidase regulatory-like domain-containing protein [Deltaproteobacteria bacterium]|nr:carboxypeptidase regulatory-like domain-containing protein [Deltaproteobacteria bacterium]
MATGAARLLVVVALATAGPAAAAPQVEIHAHTDIRPRPIHRDYDGRYVVAGQLVDRLTGAGLAGQRVFITLGGGRASAVTAADGGFAVPVAADGGRQDLHVEFRGSSALDASQLAQPDIDVDKQPIELKLAIADVKGGVQVTLTAASGATTPSVRIALTAGAADADPTTLAAVGTATTGGPAVVITRAQAGGAGRRRIHAAFAGDDVYGPAVADATIELATATTTTLAADDDTPAYEDDVYLSGSVVDEDGHGVALATVGIRAGDRRVGTAQTDVAGRFQVRFEAEVLGVGRWGLEAVVETATGWLKPSRSAPVLINVPAPAPAPVAYTLIAFVATAFVALGFWLGRNPAWIAALLRRKPRPAAPGAAPSPHADAPPTSGLVLSRPSLVSTLRRPHDHGFSGAVRDSVRARPIAGAIIELALGTEVRTAIADGAGGFAFEDLGAGEWRVTVTAPGHISERFATTIPHRGELRDARVDLVPVREQVFALYRRAALPLLPTPGLWGIWSPRQVVDHVRRRRPHQALAELTDFVEEAYFSARAPEEAILVDAEARVAAAVREQRPN